MLTYMAKRTLWTWLKLCGCYVQLLQSCPTLCSPMDSSLPGSNVHGILQARMLEWVAVPSSRGYSWLRDWVYISCMWMDSLPLSHWENPRLMAQICLQCRRPGFDPWVGTILWRRKRQAIPVFLPGEFHGQRSLVDYNPWGHKELDMTEQLTLSFLSCWIIWVGVI